MAKVRTWAGLSHPMPASSTFGQHCHPGLQAVALRDAPKSQIGGPAHAEIVRSGRSDSAWTPIAEPNLLRTRSEDAHLARSRSLMERRPTPAFVLGQMLALTARRGCLGRGAATRAQG